MIHEKLIQKMLNDYYFKENNYNKMSKLENQKFS